MSHAAFPSLSFPVCKPQLWEGLQEVRSLEGAPGRGGKAPGRVAHVLLAYYLGNIAPGQGDGVLGHLPPQNGCGLSASVPVSGEAPGAVGDVCWGWGANKWVVGGSQEEVQPKSLSPNDLLGSSAVSSAL